ncbi:MULTISPECIES: universal stress protein [unclassified Streptomyces]|uniref:universal stress protein n=1 Tax=unclassified Streptomyces TaxID=2593676 RepID=UPI0005EC645B|nr:MULTISPECIES: universal stress protein [unclassified Streptomyces]APU38580.1 universal stress protein UspA [Streptomyces sp. TN58]KJK45521.1 universal stress protein UspA [Streptomyces sp. NRRL F-4428]
MDSQGVAPRIVVGVDGSPSSQAALRWAVRYAGLVGGRVEAVTAWDLPGAGTWSAPAVDADFDEEEAERRLVEEVRTVLGEGASQVHQRLVRGNPAEVLVEQGQGADLIVVGSRGHGGFRRALLGSVSQQVAQHAACPVTIVRPDAAPE